MKERKLVVLLKSGSTSAYLAINDRMIRKKSNAIFFRLFSIMRNSCIDHLVSGVWSVVSHNTSGPTQSRWHDNSVAINLHNVKMVRKEFPEWNVIAEVNNRIVRWTPRL